MHTLAVWTVKGGVGKTAASVNLAHAASIAGARTLLWDLDPQGATSYYLRALAELGLPEAAEISGRYPVIGIKDAKVNMPRVKMNFNERDNLITNVIMELADGRIDTKNK